MPTFYGPPSDGSGVPAELADELAIDIQTPGAVLRGALDEVVREYGRVAPIVYDDFTGAPDGPLAGREPEIGPVWGTTGAMPVYLESGEATSSGTGYAYMTTEELPEAVWADVRFAVGASADDRPFAIAFCSTDGATMLNDFAAHAVFGPRGFTLEVRKDGEEPFPRLMSGQWNRQVQPGEYARIGVVVRGSTVTVFGPYGEVRSATDPRVAEQLGHTVFWEPRAVSGSQAYVRNVTATTRAEQGVASGVATLADLSGAGSFIDGGGRVTGALESLAQVGIGPDPVGSQPGVSFGAPVIRTVLQANAAVGATSISTDKIIPPGSVLQFDSGNMGETVTSGGYSSGSSVPYTTTLTTATTKAHAAGTVVTAVPDAKFRGSMYLHQGNGYFYLPAVPVLLAPGGNLYLGGTDLRIMRHAANVGGVQPSQGWRTGVFTTAGRPSASAFGKGTQIFDTDLNRPLWSNGTAWVDATGTVV